MILLYFLCIFLLIICCCRCHVWKEYQEYILTNWIPFIENAVTSLCGILFMSLYKFSIWKLIKQHNGRVRSLNMATLNMATLGDNWVRGVWSKSVVYSPNRQKKVQHPAVYTKGEVGILQYTSHDISVSVTQRRVTKLECCALCNKNLTRFYRLLQYKSNGVNFDQNSPTKNNKPRTLEREKEEG